MIVMTKEEMTEWVRRSIKARYKSISRYAYHRGIDPNRVYKVLNTGRLPRWMMREFGVKPETTYVIAR